MLAAQGIHKSYDHPAGQLHILKGITLEVAAGDVVAIVGSSGAGSPPCCILWAGWTTLRRKGHFRRQEVYKLNERERARIRNRQIGFIFQFYHLLPEFTALENVIYRPGA